jgi:hypothetical protein
MDRCQDLNFAEDLYALKEASKATTYLRDQNRA